MPFVYVGNLSPDAVVSEAFEFIKKVHQIEPHYAFVEFEDDESTNRAIEKNGTIFYGRTMTVEESSQGQVESAKKRKREEEDTPPRKYVNFTLDVSEMSDEQIRDIKCWLETKFPRACCSYDEY
jgi:RNA recognition motif-containing protein